MPRWSLCLARKQKFLIIVPILHPLRGDSLSPLALWGSKLCVCLFWPCCIPSSHKHWQSQFTQRHADKRWKWFVTSRTKSLGRLLAEEHGAGSTDREERQALLLLLGCAGEPVHHPQTQRKVVTQIPQLRQGIAGNRVWTFQQCLI